MVREYRRRDYVKAAGALGVTGVLPGFVRQGGGPELLNVIGYPESGIQIFRDYYGNFEPVHDIIVPDGLQASVLPDEVGDPMEEVIGTAPAADGPNQEAFVGLFEERFGGSPGVFNAHTYDAVALCLLANAAAGENDGTAIRDQMRRIANEPGDEYGPGEFVDAVGAAANGEDIRYVGASSVADFDDVGDPASASYDVWRFADDGFTVENTIEFETEAGGAMAEEGPGGTGRTLSVAMLLPETGDLGQLGSSMIQAGQIPANQIQESDLDFEVDLAIEDSQTDRQATLSNGEALIDAGYPAIVGAASSGNTVPLTEVTRDSGVVQCSPASTALSLSLIEDDDYFFRTAPSDILQGQVMAQVGAEELGNQTASTLFVNNDYGQQLSNQFVESFQDEHGGEVFNQVSFEIGQGSYTAELESALAP